MSSAPRNNAHERVINNFGREWAAYSNSRPSQEVHFGLIKVYFSIIPFNTLARIVMWLDTGEIISSLSQYRPA